jgi:hypothetical protein
VPLLVELEGTSVRRTRAKLWGQEFGECSTVHHVNFYSRYVISQRDVPAVVAGPLPIRFSLPRAVPETDTHQSTTWSIMVHWHSICGLPHTLTFDVPVFYNDTTSPLPAEAEDFDDVLRVGVVLGEGPVVEGHAVAVEEVVGVLGGLLRLRGELRVAGEVDAAQDDLPAVAVAELSILDGQAERGHRGRGCWRQLRSEGAGHVSITNR